MRLGLDQTGSRFLQKQLTKSKTMMINFILEEIGERFSDLMIDNYGNYFCSKLLQHCSSNQRLQVLSAIKPRFIELACNKRGTHTI